MTTPSISGDPSAMRSARDAELQKLRESVKAFLTERRADLAPAGCDNREYLAISEGLERNTTTLAQLRDYLFAKQTRERLDASGAGTTRYGTLATLLWTFLHEEDARVEALAAGRELLSRLPQDARAAVKGSAEISDDAWVESILTQEPPPALGELGFGIWMRYQLILNDVTIEQLVRCARGEPALKE